MNSQQLLFINFLIVLAIVLFFVFGRSKPKQTFKLNLKTPESPKPEEKVSLPTSTDDIIVKAKDVSGSSVYFVYNGHEWEAHEVLGLPKGSGFEVVTAHYQNLIKTSDPSTFEFYDAAYSAILKNNRK